MPQTLMEMEGIDMEHNLRITLNVIPWHYKTVLYVNEVVEYVSRRCLQSEQWPVCLVRSWLEFFTVQFENIKRQKKTKPDGVNKCLATKA